ncbi:hypothetical protein P3X46_003359 [Hevea brasiliensis]|uniref:Uncharacterized protein n=2 Tax=Hevea brasiliensis TaxID=3981 RepID=A0ABQ9N601_HEVBR|nr:uncharacterized protein LOC110661716 [Hevea brasiliensis]KAF2324996.1 hypothetical protein GH714_022140 [Hevea brasiliensis]KAJ9187952.1 hypothetical protein P3X46_003359 [Hevea brasiliensis]
MGNKNRASGSANNAAKSSFVPQERDCYEGERLARLLKLINGAIESAKHLDRNSLPEKFWFKQRFAIGVNEVTRVLERMSPTSEMEGSGQKPPPHIISTQRRNPTAVQLQAILIAQDCNPKWLTKHLPSLASSRKVPVIFVKDEKKGSLRLGELVKLKTAIAIGVKDKENSINQIVEEILSGGNEMND